MVSFPHSYSYPQDGLLKIELYTTEMERGVSRFRS